MKMSSLSYVVSEQSAMWWVVAHKILLSAPVPIGIGIRGLGLGLDNTNSQGSDTDLNIQNATHSPAGFKQLNTTDDT